MSNFLSLFIRNAQIFINIFPFRYKILFEEKEWAEQEMKLHVKIISRLKSGLFYQIYKTKSN